MRIFLEKCGALYEIRCIIEYPFPIWVEYSLLLG